jgi:hypothetical protein
MSVERRPRDRPGSRPKRGRLIAGIALLVLVFLLGVAFGQALHDNPNPGESRTFIRTFQPVPASTTTATATATP